jgi:hypothetical protein
MTARLGGSSPRASRLHAAARTGVFRTFIFVTTGVHMATDGNPGPISATSLVQGSQAITSVTVQSGSGKPLPPTGNTATAAASAAAAATKLAATRAAPQTLVDQLNKYLNDSGRPDEFRVDPASGKLIQQVNPANGVVLGEFSVDEFPALARSVGASGLLIDSLA